MGADIVPLACAVCGLPLRDFARSSHGERVTFSEAGYKRSRHKDLLCVSCILWFGHYLGLKEDEVLAMMGISSSPVGA